MLLSSCDVGEKRGGHLCVLVTDREIILAMHYTL